MNVTYKITVCKKYDDNYLLTYLLNIRQRFIKTLHLSVLGSRGLGIPKSAQTDKKFGDY